MDTQYASVWFQREFVVVERRYVFTRFSAEKYLSPIELVVGITSMVFAILITSNIIGPFLTYPAFGGLRFTCQYSYLTKESTCWFKLLERSLRLPSFTRL